MSRITIYEASVGYAKVKIDASSTFSRDVKKAHVVIVYKSKEYPSSGHWYLEDIDRFSVNYDWPDDVRRAFKQVQRMKDEIIRRYDRENPSRW